MNRLHTKAAKRMDTRQSIQEVAEQATAQADKFSHHTAIKACFTRSLLSILFLFALSSNALANRPAMENATENSRNHSESRPNIQVDTMETEAESNAPSAVELMMQKQQTYQTGSVQLPAKEIQPGETLNVQLLDYPRRGMSMDKVQNEYGQPITISDSVGQPPITRWTYNDRIVYFEYSTVLHVVAR